MESPHNAPLTFVRNGEYHYSSGSIRYRSSSSSYWESNSYSDTSARYLASGPFNLNPQRSYSKGFGFSLRCLVSLEGLQLPTYSGTKSYQNLLVGVYETITYHSIGYFHSEDTQIQSAPLNLVRGGRYNYNSGSPSEYSTVGLYWMSSSSSIINVSRLYFGSNHLILFYNDDKGRGFSLRCLVPLAFHWQLPTYSGTKSYQNLLVEVYGMREYSGLGYIPNADTTTQSIPLNFIRSGFYLGGTGNVSNINSAGSYWASSAYLITRARHLYIDKTLLYPQNYNDKNNGFSLRCLVR